MLFNQTYDLNFRPEYVFCVSDEVYKSFWETYANKLNESYFQRGGSVTVKTFSELMSDPDFSEAYRGYLTEPVE